MPATQPNQDPTINAHPVEAGHIANLLDRLGAKFGLQTGSETSLNVLPKGVSQEAQDAMLHGVPTEQLSPNAAARASALKEMPEYIEQPRV